MEQTTIGQRLDTTLSDIIRRFDEMPELEPFRLMLKRIFVSDLKVYQWPQTWGDTSCGFGGVAGQAFTTAPTLAVEVEYAGLMFIYHGGRFAYVVKSPNEQFWDDVRKFNLKGKSNYRGGYERQ